MDIFIQSVQKITFIWGDNVHLIKHHLNSNVQVFKERQSLYKKISKL